MNKVILIGRLTKDPAVAYKNADDGTQRAIARYTLAVDRGKDAADFISCVAFGKNGEFAEKYLKKGTKIAVEGRIQTGSYEKNGARVYTTDVIVEHHEFCESKSTEASASNTTNVPGVNMSVDFEDLPEGLEEELPFV